MAWLGQSQQSKLAADSRGPETQEASSPDLAKLAVPAKGHPGFESLDANKVGLTPKEKYKKPKKEPIRETGNSGLAAGDVDGDGMIDLYVCGMETPNVLYLNKGNWQFEDITIEAGVACKGWRMS